MQQIQTDVLQLTGKLLLENKARCSFVPRVWQNGYTRMIFVITDLAYFLEVELRQGVEPVGQLSEVEKLHLKPFFFPRVKFQEKKEHSRILYDYM